jgi:DNA polymerase III epsilon subunit-like protein
MSNNIIIFDIETNGLPTTPREWGTWYDPTIIKHYDTSRVVQIGLVYDREQHVWVIKPEGFEINNSEFHGITMDIAVKGVSWDKMIVEFMDIVSRYDTIVAYNAGFDTNVFASELYRRNQKETALKFTSINVECAMHLGRLYMKRGRSPKLVVLYEHLFNEKVIQKHDALDDCCITFDCYVSMKELGFPKKYHKGVTQTTVLGDVTNRTKKGIEYGVSVISDLLVNLKIKN